MLNKIPIKTPDEITLMRGACAVTAQILDEVGAIIQPGITTEDINTFVDRRTRELGAVPSPLNYKGYTKSVCTSINDVVCHGVPSGFVTLNAGDIINVDVTSFKNGFHGDSSRMYFVGGRAAVSPENIELVRITHQAMMIGIAQVRPGAHIGDIGSAIQSYIKETGGGYGIVREYTGHGLGREFHEPPQVVHMARRGSGEVMRSGMTFTVEPMINHGTGKTVLSRIDGWTVRTADGAWSAQWEHTVLVTAKGYELLTDSPRYLESLE